MGNPVSYAEETLGVHEVWADCQSRLADHAAAKETYLSSLKDLRDMKADLAGREAEITSDERGAHPDMKITEFKSHLKVVFEGDEIHKSFRDGIADVESERDRAEADMRHHELGVRALTARLHELAGLLEFYGAAKASNHKSG